MSKAVSRKIIMVFLILFFFEFSINLHIQIELLVLIVESVFVFYSSYDCFVQFQIIVTNLYLKMQKFMLLLHYQMIEDLRKLYSMVWFYIRIYTTVYLYFCIIFFINCQQIFIKGLIIFWLTLSPVTWKIY